LLNQQCTSADRGIFQWGFDHYSCYIVNQTNGVHMKTSRLTLIAATLFAAAFAAQADEADASQFANVFQGTKTRAEVQAEFDQARNAPNTYSISYNPVANFQSRVTREQVRAEFLASRDAVAAMTSEDSGSAYLPMHRRAASVNQLAGTPVNPQ
jgi:Domain of unknown function (DUF4148)